MTSSVFRRVSRILSLLAALLVTPMPLAAQDLSSLVARLGESSFSEKIEAVEALATLGDDRAISALEALGDGRLNVTAEKRVVILDGQKVIDAITLEPIAGLSPESLDRVVVNNRLRGAIATAVGKLTIFSLDRNRRLAAARNAFRSGTAETAAILERAITEEIDSEVRAAMAFSLNAARLSFGTKDERLVAIAALSGSSDPEVRALLGRLRGSADVDPDVLAAAEKAMERVESRLELIGYAENLFQGISLGSVLLLAAIGLAITFGVMGVINMAHGEMIMLGAYSAFVVQQVFRTFLPPVWIDAYLLTAIPVGFVVAASFGMALERCVIRFLYGRPLETLLATWGISLILQQLVRTIFGAPNKEVANPSWMTGGFEVVAGFVVTWNRLYIVIFCFVVLASIAAVLRYTTFGLQMRAVTQNRDMASAMGVRTARVDTLTFGLGSGIAGMAGVALSQIGNVSPNLGTFYIVDSFMVVVFGGVGNLLGTLVAAMSLGIVNKFLEPFAGAVLGKIAVLIFIILFIQKRPRGLFALRGRAAEA